MTTEGPIQVAAGNDDAHEKDNGSGFSASGIFVNFIGSTSASLRGNGGFKFDSVDIAAGSTIDDVDVQVYLFYSGDSIQCFIRADVGSAADFSANADVTTRLATASAAAVSWTVLNIIPGNAFHGSFSDDGVDAKAVLQEVIDDGGWASGNDVVILLEGQESSFDYCDAVAYNFAAANAAKLTINYTGGGGGPAVLASRRLLSGTGR